MHLDALGALSRPAGLTLVVAAVAGVAVAVGVGARARPDAPPAVATAPLPAWFGLPELPARRIAGQLREDNGDGSVGEPVAGTVHLRIEAPDATSWRGLDVVTTADGRFDLGELRAGRYYLLAVTPGETSASVLVDTRRGPIAPLSIALAPCTTISRTVTDAAGDAIAGARLDVAGVHVATTDESGHYRVCLMAGSMPPIVRAAGYAPEELVVRDGRVVRDVALAPAMSFRGHVTGADGLPAAGVLVQPMIKRHGMYYDSWMQLPVQAITDANGDFVVEGVSARDHVVAHDEDTSPETPATYWFHAIRHDEEVYDPHSSIAADDAAAGRARAEVSLGPWPRAARLDERKFH